MQLTPKRVGSVHPSFPPKCGCPQALFAGYVPDLILAAYMLFAGLSQRVVSLAQY